MLLKKNALLLLLFLQLKFYLLKSEPLIDEKLLAKIQLSIEILNATLIDSI